MKIYMSILHRDRYFIIVKLKTGKIRNDYELINYFGIKEQEYAKMLKKYNLFFNEDFLTIDTLFNDKQEYRNFLECFLIKRIMQ